MTEYKENTVGWHLNRLKEPLRSRAIDILSNFGLSFDCKGITTACEWVLDAFTEGSDEWLFWKGVVTCYGGGVIKDQPTFMKGFNMAKECAPDPEKRDYTKAQWDDAQRLSDHENSMEEAFQNMVAGSPPLDLVSTGLGVMDTGNHPRLTNEQQSFQVAVVDVPVVHGYTPPRPVETIEGRHDRELKEHAARIAALEDKNKDLWDRGDFQSAKIDELQDYAIGLEKRIIALQGLIMKMGGLPI